jgi:hypothetical protein
MPRMGVLESWLYAGRRRMNILGDGLLKPGIPSQKEAKNSCLSLLKV